jgi:hypothetical protein
MTIPDRDSPKIPADAVLRTDAKQCHFRNLVASQCGVLRKRTIAFVPKKYPMLRRGTAVGNIDVLMVPSEPFILKHGIGGVFAIVPGPPNTVGVWNVSELGVLPYCRDPEQRHPHFNSQ